ncbi:MAG TPA: hypothetical protein VF087_03890 [Solirubrobacteraceae bacterium]
MRAVHPGEPMKDFDLAFETQAYQVLLEGHRAAPDDELIYQDMLKAKAAMEIAWLRASAGRPANGGFLAQ